MVAIELPLAKPTWCSWSRRFCFLSITRGYGDCSLGFPKPCFLDSVNPSICFYPHLYMIPHQRVFLFSGCWVGAEYSCSECCYGSQISSTLEPSTTAPSLYPQELGPTLLCSQLSSSNTYFQNPHLNEGRGSFACFPIVLEVQSYWHTSDQEGQTQRGRENTLNVYP